MNVLNKISHTLNKQASMKSMPPTGSTGGITPSDQQSFLPSSGRTPPISHSRQEILSTTTSSILNELRSRNSSRSDIELIEELCAITLSPEQIANISIELLHGSLALKEWSLQKKQKQQQQHQHSQRHTISGSSSLQPQTGAIVNQSSSDQSQQETYDRLQSTAKETPETDGNSRVQGAFSSTFGGTVMMLSDQVHRRDQHQLAYAHLQYWLRCGVAADSYHLQRARVLYEAYLKQAHTKFLTSNDRTPPSAVALLSVGSTESSALAASRKQVQETRVKVEYCKVLMFLGEIDSAADVIRTVVVQSESSDLHIADYLFYAGCIYKAKGEYEKANNYFFDANQSGPPQFFSQIEMMTVISRNLEELTTNGTDFDSDALEDDNEDAYQMVHAHLILEGIIDESIEYDDWISDARTWLELGDKCVLHDMYSLATDFYGLGIMRDADAFRKPMLWYKFAKSCHRCGRSADAQLAVKQALSRAPFNTQLRHAYRVWHKEYDEGTPFRDIIATSKIEDIIGLMPTEEQPTGLQQLVKFQAIVRGVLARINLRLGVGARRDIVMKRMHAKAGVLVRNSLSSTPRPLLISVTPSWMGSISHINFFDMLTDRTGSIKLRTPFAPGMETGAPKKLMLSIECKHVPMRNSGVSLMALSSGEAAVINRKKSQRASVNMVKKQRRRTLLKDVGRDDGVVEDEEDGSGDGGVIDDGAIEEYEELYDVMLTLKFTDVGSGHYVYRKMRLLAPSISAPSSIELQQTVASNVPEGAVALSGGVGTPPASIGTRSGMHLENMQLEEVSLQEHHKFIEQQKAVLAAVSPRSMLSQRSNSSKSQALIHMLEEIAAVEGKNEITNAAGGSRISGQSGEDEILSIAGRSVVSLTNIRTIDVLKTGVHRNGHFFLVRVVNEDDVTQVSFFDISTNNTFIFIMVREYIDRMAKLRKRFHMLLNILEANPLLAPLLIGDFPLTTEEAAQHSNPTFLYGVHCFTEVQPDGLCATIIIVEPNSQPMLGSGFEILEHHDLEEHQSNLSPPQLVADDVVDDTIYGEVTFASDDISGGVDGTLPTGNVPSALPPYHEVIAVHDGHDNIAVELDADDLAILRKGGALDDDSSSLAAQTKSVATEESYALGKEIGAGKAEIDVLDAFADVLNAFEQELEDGAAPESTAAAVEEVKQKALSEQMQVAREAQDREQQEISAVAVADQMWTDLERELVHVVQDSLREYREEEARQRQKEATKNIEAVNKSVEDISIDAVSAMTSIITDEQILAAVHRICDFNRESARKRAAYLVLDWTRKLYGQVVTKTLLTEKVLFRIVDEVVAESVNAIAEESQEEHYLNSLTDEELKESQQMLLEDINYYMPTGKDIKELRRRSSLMQRQQLIAKLHAMPHHLAGIESEGSSEASSDDDFEMEESHSLEPQSKYFVNKIRSLVEITSSGDEGRIIRTARPSLSALSSMSGKVVPSLLPRRDTFTPQITLESDGESRNRSSSRSHSPDLVHNIVPGSGIGDRAARSNSSKVAPPLQSMISISSVTPDGLVVFTEDSNKVDTTVKVNSKELSIVRGIQREEFPQLPAHVTRSSFFTPVPADLDINASVLTINEHTGSHASAAAAAEQISRRRSVAAISHHNREVLNSRRSHVQNTAPPNVIIEEDSTASLLVLPAQVPGFGGDLIPKRASDVYYNQWSLEELKKSEYPRPQWFSTKSGADIFSGDGRKEELFNQSGGIDKQPTRVKSRKEKRSTARWAKPAPGVTPDAHTPAFNLPGYAFESAEGLKRALDNDWNDCTVASYFADSMALKSDSRQTHSLRNSSRRSIRPSSRPSTSESNSCRDRSSRSQKRPRTSQKNNFTQSEGTRELQEESEPMTPTFFAKPFSRIGTRVTCRSPPDHSVHFRATHPALMDATEIYLAEKRCGNDALYRESLETYHRVGYMQQEERPLAHATHWNRRITSYLTSLHNIDELKKRITTLKHTAPEALTTEEAVCALADTEGSVGGVVDKLRNLEFISELKLVCRSLNVRSMVLRLDRGEEVFWLSNTALQRDADDFQVKREESLVNPTSPEYDRNHNYDTDRKSSTVGPDESTFIFNPFGSRFQESHPEVVKHLSLRKQYENSLHQTDAGKKITVGLRLPTDASVLPVPNPKVVTRGGRNVTSLLSDPAATAHEVATAGIFKHAGRTQLSQASPYVLGRSSVVSLERAGSARARPSTMEGEGSAAFTSSEKRPRSSSDAVDGGRGSGEARLIRNSISIHSTLARTPLGQPVEQNSAKAISEAISNAISVVQNLESSIPRPLSELSGLHAMKSSADLLKSTPNMKATAAHLATSASDQEENHNSKPGLLRRSASSIGDVYRQSSGKMPAPLNRSKSMEIAPSGAAYPNTCNVDQEATPIQLPAFKSPPKSSISRGPSLRGLKNYAVSFVQPSEDAPHSGNSSLSFYGTTHSGTTDDGDHHWHGGTVELMQPGSIPTKREVQLQQQQLQERILALQQETSDDAADEIGGKKSGSDNLVSMNNWYAGNRPKQRAMWETRKSQGTFRIKGRIEDLFDQVDAPISVMSRRDAIKASREELLLRSNKAHIREPIVKKGVKIANMTRRSSDAGDPFSRISSERSDAFGD